MCTICTVTAEQVATDDTRRAQLEKELQDALGEACHVHVGLSTTWDNGLHAWSWGVIVWADHTDDRCPMGHELPLTIEEPPAALYDFGWAPTDGTPPQCHACGAGIMRWVEWEKITPQTVGCVITATQELATALSTGWAETVKDVNAARRAALIKALKQAVRDAGTMTRDEYGEVIGFPSVTDDEGIIWDEGMPTPHAAFMPPVAAEEGDTITVTLTDLT